MTFWHSPGTVATVCGWGWQTYNLLMSGFRVPKWLKSVHFWRSYSKNKNVSVFWGDTVYIHKIKKTTDATPNKTGQLEEKICWPWGGKVKGQGHGDAMVSLRKAYLTNRLWEFRQIYNLGTVLGKDELVILRSKSRIQNVPFWRNRSDWRFAVENHLDSFSKCS